LNSWHPALEKDEIVEGTNNTVGAVRLLTLKDGGTIKESCRVRRRASSVRYTILEGVMPVSDYTSILAVASAGKGKTTVTGRGVSTARTPATTPRITRMTRPRSAPSPAFIRGGSRI